MSTCISTDKISPKHSDIVKIINVNAIPVSSTLTYATTEVTANPISYKTGSLVTVMMPAMSFTGDGSVVVGTITGITSCNQNTYWPIIVDIDRTFGVGMLYLQTTNVLTLYPTTSSNDTFSNGTAVTIYPIVLQYRASL